MIYKSIKKRDGYKVKDFCLLWRRTYYKKYKRPFLISWSKDIIRFRYLLSIYKPRELKELIKFAFSNSKETEFLRSTGYNIAAFSSQINSFNVAIQREAKGLVVNNKHSPYYEDPKFSLLITYIQHSDLQFLVENLAIKDFKVIWKDLILKSEQAGDIKFTKKAKYCFVSWVKGEKFLRQRIKKN